MFSRRELLTAGMAGGFASTANASPAATTHSQEAGELRSIANEIRGLDGSISRALLSNGIVFGHAERVRAQFETYFRTHQRFPDFIDVGLSVFLDVYDWHIKNRQELMISRGPDARYWLQFMFTTLILRGEQEPNFVGLPYDKA